MMPLDRNVLLVNKLDSSDIVLTMTHEHKLHILRFYPEYEDKVWVLTEYVEPTKLVDVDDPYGLPYESYEDVYQQLKVLLEKIIEKTWTFRPLKNEIKIPYNIVDVHFEVHI